VASLEICLRCQHYAFNPFDVDDNSFWTCLLSGNNLVEEGKEVPPCCPFEVEHFIASGD
jgi:hypothetical protein